ncbi:MAG: hemerythrin family protein [Sulfuricella sp.]|nr:hemerythrin family protein [Sulfuricella sp.]
MPLIDWNESLEIGFRPIDADHKRLVALLNELHEYLVSGSSLSLIHSAFQRIARHTATHFRHEEALMAESGYPDAPNHCLAHQELEKQMADLLQRLDEGASVFSQELVDFLKNWLINHITTMDTALGHYLAGQNA